MINLVLRNKYREDRQLSAIIEILDEREKCLNTRLDIHMEKEQEKLDKIISGFNQLEKELGQLAAIVSSNHTSAMSSINDKKHEIREEASNKYATKEDLSNGLSSIRNTAKLVWAMVIGISAVVAWLSSRGIL